MNATMTNCEPQASADAGNLLDGPGDYGNDRPPRWMVAGLADTYNSQRLRKILHDAEIEAYAANFWDHSDAGWWQNMVLLYREALEFRRHIEGHRAAKAAKQRGFTAGHSIDFAKLKAHIDIIEYVNHFTPLRRQGKSYRGRCIFHNDQRTPNLVVWTDPPVFRCFACDAKGDVISFRKLLAERGMA